MMVVRDLAKRYGRVEAVRDVSFTAANGLVTGLVGPNGAGKTTVLRSLSGLLHPDRGAVEIDGIAVAARPADARRRLGVLPEVTGLYDHLTVRENVRYAGELQDVDTDLTSHVDALLTAFSLDALGDRRAGTLSLGQRRRVAMARALVHAPANVILDEPTNGLDVLSARTVRRAARRLAGEGRAVLVSSHLMTEVAEVCDHVVMLSYGRVVAAGTPADLLSRTGRPTLEDAFVAVIGHEEGLQ
jgi:sodium transport system ATP-binding protein